MLQTDTPMDRQFALAQMVEQQIRTWDVLDERLLDVFRKLPRADFVPAAWQRLAYADAEIPLDHGERMMRPSVEGRLLQALEPRSADEVLEIGTGSGFLTACLARLSASVVSVDIHDDFLKSAVGKLERADIDNVSLKRHDGATDGPPPGQFDVIAITGSLPTADERFLEAIRPGGRLFVVVGDAPVMEARLYTRDADGGLRSRAVFETCLPRLQNVVEPSQFSF